MPPIRFRATLALLTILFLAGRVLATDLRVPADHPTLAAALAEAAPGDRVVLAPGVYRESDLDVPGGVTLYGDPTDPGAVVIDGGGAGRVLRAESLEAVVVITGLTITGGHASGPNCYERSGGGLLASRADVRLQYARLVGNTAAGSGGGLRAVDCSVVMVGCEVADNSAGKGGGGIDVSYGASVDVLQTEIIGNDAAWGGGLSVRAGSSVNVRTGRLQANTALAAPGLGGAVACDSGATQVMTQTVLADNAARYGGAVFTAGNAFSRFRFATLDRNAVETGGGAFYCKGTTLDLDRAIVSDHPQAAFVCLDHARLSLSRSDIHGNAGGDWVGDLAGLLGVDGNFSAPPLYCAPDDRHLQAGSPCAPDQTGFGLVGALGVGCETATGAPSPARDLRVGAHPNPFNPRTEITYTLPQAGRTRLSVYDVRGRRLDVLVDEALPAGEHRVRWSARDGAGRALATGTYVLVVESAGRRATTKLLLMR
jgi:hypothetical protein